MELFTYHSHIDARTVRARTLVVTINGFHDVGHAQQGLTSALTDHLNGHAIGTFDTDSLIDYRDQRPVMVFESDHFADYRKPELGLQAMTDEAGEHFLLLSGPEPAFRWEALGAVIDRIVRTHDVQLVVFAAGIPMAAPHTRPIVVTKWATDPDLIAGNQPLFGTVMMPASFPNMLALRLGEQDHRVVGLAAHVPHYLADTDYPDATLALIRSINEVTGLHLPSQAVALAAGVVRAQIGTQVAASEELTEMVQTLEQHYDQTVGQREITAASEDVPTADEIGLEVENFLKGLGDDGKGGDPSSNPFQPGSAQAEDNGPDDSFEAGDQRPDDEPPATV